MTGIAIKDAVKAAKVKINELYEDDLPQALALEEIDLVEEGERKLWSVTLGFRRNRSVTSINANALGAIYNKPEPIENRVYKTIYLDANTGDFVRMDMRLV